MLEGQASVERCGCTRTFGPVIAIPLHMRVAEAASSMRLADYCPRRNLLSNMEATFKCCFDAISCKKTE